MAQAKDKMSEIDEHIMKRFDIQKRLGKGAYGIVWKAIDRKTKETVAVKKIFDAFRNQTDAQRTFREIVFLQSFKNHPNIVRLHSIHRAANNKDIYLGFEYMETDLHNVIKRGNILKDIHNRYIMYQLLKALKYIHSGHVIHRDLKPSNVLLDCMCRCKIADFGLARSLTQMGDGSSEGDGMLTDYVATRWYRAPEILIANRRYTKGIDMWSIGCILAEMSAGKPIFPGTSTVNQVEKIMATIPTPTKEDIDTVCISGVGSCMIKNASSVAKVPVRTLLGSNVPEDALTLLNRLLIFNPLKRLTAEQALEHDYVAKFHDPDQEIGLNASVSVPLNDDVRLSVDDYRNKLYELLSAHHQARPRPRPDHYPDKATMYGRSKDVSTSAVQSRISRNAEKFFRTHRQPHEQPLSQSESKICCQSKPPSRRTTAGNAKSESKVATQQQQQQRPSQEARAARGGGDFDGRAYMKSTSELQSKERSAKRRFLQQQKNLAFNSYHKTHGVITESALMELRAAGMR